MKILLMVALLVAAEARARNNEHGESAEAERSVEWGYGEDNGPDTWPTNFPTCGGSSQSPVALDTSGADTGYHLKRLNFTNYEALPWAVTLTNTGHSAQITLDVDASVAGGGLSDVYRFHQFHFHWGSSDVRGSEHTVDHARFPAELHLVHYKASYGTFSEALKHPDGLAVLGVMLQLSYEDNPNLQPIINGLVDVVFPHQMAFIDPIALRDLLPGNLDYFFSYQGSLTTPPCSEVVAWTVLMDTLPISRNQLEHFRGLMGEDGHDVVDNYRTLQPINYRKIYRSWIPRPAKTYLPPASSYLPPPTR